MQIHATVVSIDGNGVILRGPSGCGKSDLALRLISAGAVLVADDRCDIMCDVMKSGATLTASAPAEIAGLLEVRGLGIVRLDHLASTPVRLICDLSNDGDIERLPKPDLCSDLGHPLTCIRMEPFEASAPDKVRLALRHAIGDLELIS